jgi:hypothetical protein
VEIVTVLTVQFPRYIGIIALTLCLSGCGLVQKERWFPPAPLMEVTVRQLPSFQTIEAIAQGRLDRDWDNGFRQNARYLATISSPLRYPVILALPAWQEGAPEPTTEFFVQLILADQADYRAPREQGLALLEHASSSVACYAWQGAYSYENFVRAHTKVREFLTAQRIPVSGSPRVLLYHNPDWMPQAWCVGEVQVPVPDKITVD